MAHCSFADPMCFDIVACGGIVNGVCPLCLRSTTTLADFLCYRPPSLYQIHHDDIINHLLQSGFHTGVSALFAHGYSKAHTRPIELRRYTIGEYYVCQVFYGILRISPACSWHCIPTTRSHLISITIPCTPHVHYTAKQ